MAPGMVGLKLFMKSAPSLMALEVMNALFAWVGQLALALGRDHKCEDFCQPLGCLGVRVAWKSHVAFGLNPFFKPAEDYRQRPSSPSLRLGVLSTLCLYGPICSQALEVGPGYAHLFQNTASYCFLGGCVINCVPNVSDVCAHFQVLLVRHISSISSLVPTLLLGALCWTCQS